MKWLSIAMRIFPFIIGAVHGVEAMRGALSGQAKQDAAIDMVKAMVQAADAGVGRDLVNDDDVVRATRAVIDAYVALQNVIARKAAAAQAAPVGG